MFSKITVRVAGTALLLAACAPATAFDLSFRGTFQDDDDIQFIDFVVERLSTVTLKTLSYAGGVNAAGEVIPRGGFDPALALFHESGQIISGGDNSLGVAEDPLTYRRFDALFELELGPGAYRLAITQYDNSALGPTIDDIFTRDGRGNFTPTMTFCEADRFCDVSGVLPWNQRTGQWAVDVLNVQSALLVPPSVPEPATGVLTAAGLGLLGLLRRRHTR